MKKAHEIFKAKVQNEKQHGVVERVPLESVHLKLTANIRLEGAIL